MVNDDDDDDNELAPEYMHVHCSDSPLMGSPLSQQCLAPNGRFITKWILSNVTRFCVLYSLPYEQIFIMQSNSIVYVCVCVVYIR